MWMAKWWTPDTVFAAIVGGVMMVVLGMSMVVGIGSRTGSDLLPATVIDRVRAQEAACQTVTDDEAMAGVPGRC